VTQLRRPSTKIRPGWTRIEPGSYRHASGWEAHHCGHRTAIYPYFLIDPSQPECIVFSHNGLGFGCLEIALLAAEGAVAGRMAALDVGMAPFGSRARRGKVIRVGNGPPCRALRAVGGAT
jgi:hypothetical protein